MTQYIQYVEYLTATVFQETAISQHTANIREEAAYIRPPFKREATGEVLTIIQG